MKHADDFTLVQQINRNNKEAFNELFRRYYTPLCRYALKITQSENAAEEAVQFIYIKLWDSRHKLEVSQSVASYLFKAVRLKIYENYRSLKIKAKHEEEFINQQDYITSETHSEPDNYELACLIWNAVDQLPDKCAEIFRLSRDEGLTYNEIAQHLNISAKTVENQMGIAFKKLRETLYSVLKAKGWDNYSIGLFIVCCSTLCLAINAGAR